MASKTSLISPELTSLKGSKFSRKKNNSFYLREDRMSPSMGASKKEEEAATKQDKQMCRHDADVK